jgi:hypothetical protein
MAATLLLDSSSQVATLAWLYRGTLLPAPTPSKTTLLLLFRDLLMVASSQTAPSDNSLPYLKAKITPSRRTCLAHRFLILFDSK